MRIGEGVVIINFILSCFLLISGLLLSFLVCSEVDEGLPGIPYAAPDPAPDLARDVFERHQRVVSSVQLRAPSLDIAQRALEGICGVHPATHWRPLHACGDGI